jgi:hypothetical protein
VVSANQVPDHATIARFLKANEQALSSLFCQVLALCHAAGLLKVGTVALDGTKMAANASAQAYRTRRQVEAALAEAIATDEAEDARYGDARGDELPPRAGRPEVTPGPHRRGQSPPGRTRRPTPSRARATPNSQSSS